MPTAGTGVADAVRFAVLHARRARRRRRRRWSRRSRAAAAGRRPSATRARPRRVTSLRYRAFGFSRPCRAFFTLTARSRPRSRRTAPSGGGRRARSTSGWSRRAAGTAASPGRRAARRRSGRGSPSAWCRRRRRARRRTARRGSAPGPPRAPSRRTRTRRTTRRDLAPGPAERLRERRAGDVAGVAVAHRVGAGDELDVAPVDAGVGQRRPGRDDAVLDEVAAPLAPGVHARTHGDRRSVSRRHLPSSVADPPGSTSTPA